MREGELRAFQSGVWRSEGGLQSCQVASGEHSQQTQKEEMRKNRNENRKERKKDRGGGEEGVEENEKV